MPEQTRHSELPLSKKTPLIELKNVSKSYGGKGGALQVRILHEVSLSIYPGEFVAIIGASGSGKSTLMNILGCLDRASSGEYLFAGHEVADFTPDQLAWLRREAFGFVFQSYQLINSLDITHNIQLAALYAGIPKRVRVERANQLLQQLGLEERSDYMPRQLSGGQQQRACVARALMNGGHIIFADEPTGALDSTSGQEVMGLLKSLSQQGHTIVLITHDAKVAAQADRIIQISDGRLVEDSIQVDNGVRGSRTNDALASELIQKMQYRLRIKASVINEVKEALLGAWRLLWQAWFRTLLTLLGIVIGVASVVVLMGVGMGSSEKTLSSLNALGGVNRVSIWGQSDPITGIRGLFSTSDIEQVRRIDNVGLAVPYHVIEKSVMIGNNRMTTWILPTASAGMKVLNIKIKQGIFFSAEDDVQMPAVAVLGKKTRMQLFTDPQINPVGQYIYIDKIPFKVIGIRDETGDDEEDHTIMVPIDSAAYRLMGNRDFFAIQTHITDLTRVNETVAEIEKVLLESRGRLDFRVFNNPVQAQAQNEGNRQQALLLSLIAGISLVVGGIGVMNIMLMAVKERTQEIGIRMAIGARPRDIRRQFLTEAVLVSLVGGTVGVIFAVLICTILMLSGFAVVISVRAVLLAFASAVVTGLIFGFMPARNAAKMNPVQALAGE